jgi:hypothetical protein
MTVPKKVGRGRPKKDPSNWTPPRQFRLSDGTLAELDFLMTRFGLTSRSEVIRHLARKAALAEGYEDSRT